MAICVHVGKECCGVCMCTTLNDQNCCRVSETKGGIGTVVAHIYRVSVYVYILRIYRTSTYPSHFSGYGLSLSKTVKVCSGPRCPNLSIFCSFGLRALNTRRTDEKKN